jgi:hypothetical protein
MIITRYAHQVEVEIEGQRKMSIDVRRVRGAALSAERAGARLINALVLSMDGSYGAGSEQRIEGGASMLAAVHQTVLEAMAELAEDAELDDRASYEPPHDEMLRRLMH